MNQVVISRREESAPIVFKINDTIVSENVYKTYRYLLNRQGQFLPLVTIGMAFGRPYDLSAGWASVQLRTLMSLRIAEKRYETGNHQPVVYGIPHPEAVDNGRYLQ